MLYTEKGDEYNRKIKQEGINGILGTTMMLLEYFCPFIFPIFSLALHASSLVKNSQYKSFYLGKSLIVDHSYFGK